MQLLSEIVNRRPKSNTSRTQLLLDEETSLDQTNQAAPCRTLVSLRFKALSPDYPNPLELAVG
jgi:hypothetical protein